MGSRRLSGEKCVACEGGTPGLAIPEILKFRKQLSALWEIAGDKKISRTFEFKNFRQAMDFVNKIAEIAETEGHHPDLIISYNKVTVELYTHASGGLSKNDFIMAAKIEKLEDGR